MNTGIALMIIGGLIAILLFTQWDDTKSTPAKSSESSKDPLTIIDERPIYVYPTTYTSSPWRIPAYSYGSIYAYRRFHSPIVSPRRHGPSVIPRISMSHPIRSRGGGRRGRH